MSAVSRPTLIEAKNQRFLIMDAPTDSNLSKYIEILKKTKVKHVVRTCSPTYSIEPLVAAGIKVTELPFVDGEPPPNSLIDKWLDLLKKEFTEDKEAVVAVHCVAGLGRAPVLVAVALIEGGMEPMSAIALIRKKRKGAINTKQLKFLEQYKPKKGDGKCLMM